ncbi:MAG: autoantigen p27 domain-containing protein, partial [Planctomycetales bacterium]
MPITVACPQCNARFQAPDAYAGQVTPCPQCGTNMTIPQASPAPSHPPPANADPFAMNPPASPMGQALPTSPATPKTASHCPNCAAPLQQGSVLCVGCGCRFDDSQAGSSEPGKKKKKRKKKKKKAGPLGGDWTGDGEGPPAWGYAVIL